jgi:RNA polymerase sigma-70 factor (ECF subfamily)
LRVLGNGEEAKDISQAAMAALERSPTLPDQTAAWIGTVATNLALNEVRRRGRADAAFLRIAGKHWQRNPQDFADHVAARLLVDELLNKLPERQRQALELRYLLDLDQMTVAKLMGITLETLRTHTKRGLASARLLMLGEGGDDT